MTNIPVNTLDTKYTSLAKLLAKPKNDTLKYDTYYSFPVKISSIDYGYITLSDGSIKKMFVASNEADELKTNTIYFSEDGVNWFNIDFPVVESTSVYNKICIFNGSIYMLYDDKLCKLSNFDIENGIMTKTDIEGEAYDIIVIKNELWALAHNGIYRVLSDDKYSDLIQITGDFVFERFINSAVDDLVLMGYADKFPVFVLFDGEPHPIFITADFQIQTAISYKDYIYCYTKDERIITIYKTQDLSKTSYSVYAGYRWSGEVYYYHSYFWIAYTEFVNNEFFTYVAKSNNGIDFEADVKVPRESENAGAFVIATTPDMESIVCIGLGDLYTLIPSINYFSYGKANILNTCYDLTESREVTITQTDFSDVDNFSKYNIKVSVVYGKTILDTDVKFDISPRVKDHSIVFKLKDKEYDIPEVEPEELEVLEDDSEEESDELPDEEIVVEPDKLQVRVLIYGIESVC